MAERIAHTLSGLTLVISNKSDIERDAVADAWERRGGEVLRLGRFWDPPELEPASVRLYGADTFCLVVAQKLGIDLLSPADDVLVNVPADLLGRTLSISPLIDVGASLPRFVKPVAPKIFRAGVYESREELETETRGLEPDTPCYLSEVVKVTAEARCWMLDDRVVGSAAYEGTLDLDAASALAEKIASQVELPAACVVDVGLLKGRGLALIEANAAWGAGLNGCDADAIVVCIERASRPENT